jgi:hypothetical protein
MNVIIVTGNSDPPIFKITKSVRRAVKPNVIMVSRNNHFRVVSIVVIMMVMRSGRAADPNVVMIARNNHFIAIAIVVMVVMG